MLPVLQEFSCALSFMGHPSCSSTLSYVRSPPHRPNLVAKLCAVERIHVVWRPSPSSGRLECKPYLVCLAVLLGYGGIVGVLFYGRLSPLDGGVCCSQKCRSNFILWRQRCMLHRPEEIVQHCAINLRFVSHLFPPFIRLLTSQYSLVNAVLTGLFLWPVVRSSTRNTRVWRLALRTLWSALLALTTSCVNILILTLMHGRQLGWVCLGSCGTDVSSRTD